MNSPLRIAILGVSGRMGEALLRALDEVPGAVLSGATASLNSRWIGSDAGVPGRGLIRNIAITDDVSAALRDAHVAIDFTLPDATTANVAACVSSGCPLVLGTTGQPSDVLERIDQATKRIPIVVSANMSLGVNLLLRLAQLAARSLDDGYDIEIFEAHHRNKKDAPSGTALALGRAVANGRGVDLNAVGIFAREGETGVRGRGDIGFSVFRGGDVVGDHTVTFAGIGERIELTHKASDRMAFSRGALAAAKWIVGRPAGSYSMQDVLGIA